MILRLALLVEQREKKIIDHEQINDVTIKVMNLHMWQAASEEIPI